MAPGDSVTVHEVTPPRLRTVTVRGNVWVEGEVGHAPGMRLSEAIRLAGGPKPDVYLGRILVTRVREDSSMVQLRSAFRDSTGPLPTTSCWRRRTRSGSSPAPPSGPSATSRWWARCGSRDGSPIALG